MVEIGKYNTLDIVKILDFGAYLDAKELGEILLPVKQLPPTAKVGDHLEIFIYNDSEDRLIATCKEPLAVADEFAVLKVVEVNKTGAWLDWGLEKHLLVPFNEQKQNMLADKSYLVYVYLDKQTKRLVASSKLQKFLDNVPPEYTEGQEVNLLISNKTELAYTAIINNMHSGLIYTNEVFKKLKRGEKIKGYIKKVREDEKIDLTLEKIGYEKIDNISETILETIKSHHGYLLLSDNSSPEEIKKLLGISKKNFKKAIGALYKKQLITIEKKGIRLKI